MCMNGILAVIGFISGIIFIPYIIGYVFCKIGYYEETIFMRWVLGMTVIIITISLIGLVVIPSYFIYRYFC